MRVHLAVRIGSWKQLFLKKMAGGGSGKRAVLAGAVCALAFGVLGLAPGARAQATAQFSYAQSTIGSGLSSPQGVAVDPSGSVYISTYGSGRVLKETLGSGGTYTQSVVAGGLSTQAGVAVDATGNVYIADTGNHRVLKETLSGGSYTQSTVVSGLGGYPGYVAVDASGNVYVSEQGTVSGTGAVLKETPGSGGTYTQSTIGSGLSFLQGVAVDGSGNVYFAEGSNRVLKETLGSGGTYTQSTVASGLNVPRGVAVDASGNVYVADEDNNRVLKETLGTGGTYTQSVIVGGLNYPFGVAVDASGNDVYIADTGNNRVLELQTAGVNFHTVAVGSTSAAQTLTFTFTAAGTIAAPSVVTKGAAGLDFADAGTGTCDTNGTSHSYAIGDTCTVDVTFAPTKAGTRYGGVNLADASGAVIATAYLYGTGQGPQVAFGPGVQSTIGSGMGEPYDVAVDASGNVYIADGGTDRVLKETLSGGSYTQSVIGSGLNYPTGVAVDGSGNVYIVDRLNNRVLKETLEPGGSYTQSTVVSGMLQPIGMAVDASGNVYITNTVTLSVFKETLEPDGTYTESTVVGGLNQPLGVAVDASGNVYIADAGTRVLKETLNADGTYTQSTIGSGWNQPFGVAVDASGNVYVADSFNNRVVKETLQSGGTYVQSTVASSGLNTPQGVAVDGSGNVYIADSYNQRVLKEDLADAPSLSFASTPVGATSSDSPQTVTLENIGNAPLSIEPPASGENPAILGNFTLDSSLTCPVIDASASAATLAAGASCTLPVDFMPQAAGALTGSLAITDDNLNALPAAYATQTIQLSGTATPATFALSMASSSGTLGIGQTADAPVTVTPEGSFTSPISFTCATSKPDIYCRVSPSSVTLSGAPSNLDLYIWPEIGSSAVLPGGPGTWNWPLAGLGLLSVLGLLLWLVGRGRVSGRVRRLVWTGALATALGLSLVGCSSGNKIAPAAPGTYTVTVTGTSGSQTQTAQTSVTVK